jgi:hypothetical protein
MEIGATSSSVYLPPAFAEPRAPRDAVHKVSVTPSSAVPVNGDRKELATTQTGLPEDVVMDLASQARLAVDVRNERDSIQREKAADDAVPQRDVALAGGGGIKLDVEDGHRVLKVFDSKDVLIYQLPPKGALMLITAQEQAQQPQVRTSA